MKLNAAVVVVSSLVSTPALAASYQFQGPLPTVRHEVRTGIYPSVGKSIHGPTVAYISGDSEGPGHSVGELWFPDSGEVRPLLAETKGIQVHTSFVTLTNAQGNFSYDIKTGMMLQLSNWSWLSTPAADGELFAWSESANNAARIRARDQGETFSITEGGAWEVRNPTISTGFLAWQHRAAHNLSQIAVRKLSSPGSYMVPGMGYETHPHFISDQEIAYSTAASVWSHPVVVVHKIDQPTYSDITDGRCKEYTAPRGHGRFVVYMGSNACPEGDGPYLFLSDLYTGKTYIVGTGPLTEPTHGTLSYDVHANYVVWQSHTDKFSFAQINL